jgi:DNA adenine methylase
VHTSRTQCSPFIKWAGGKRQLLAELDRRLPAGWNTYFEPFVGGGALLVHLENKGRINSAVIADINQELINLYHIVKQHPCRLLSAVLNDEFRNDADSFNRWKREFNQIMGTRGYEVERAAILIYLNRYGFNGLWRVNNRGEFNVPFGRHADRTLVCESSLIQFSSLLKKVQILNADFESAVRSAKRGDFVYFDPPYMPVSKTAKFTDYNSRGFRIADQERLAARFRKLSKKGVQVMLSNSKVPEIEELYRDFHIETVEAKRYINCNGLRRNGTQEIIVTNYEY